MIGAFLFLLGLAIGSFLNVCIYRIPKGLSIVKPSSFCPNCKTPIKFYHNIPIISYLFLKGKCRYCGASISIQYPAVELITALLNVALYLRYGLCLRLFLMMPFAYALVVITVIDIRHQIIPDVITMPGMVAGLLINLFDNIGILRSSLGLLIGGGSLFLISWLYFLMTGKEGMGGGDIKLIAMIGAWLGVGAILPVVLIASFSGTVVGIIYLSLMKKEKDFPIPFGPFLSFGAILYMLFERAISYIFPMP